MEPRNPPTDAKLFFAADLCRPDPTTLADDLAGLGSSGLLGSAGPEALRGNAAAREYLERSQAFDGAVAKAFADVPVPVGSLERVLAAVAKQEAELREHESVTTPAAATLVPASRTPDASPRGEPFSRRRWLAACGSAAATTAAGFGVFFWWQSRQRAELTHDELLQQALAFYGSPEALKSPAVPVNQTPPPAEYPLSRAIVAMRDVPRWRMLEGQFLGRSGVAYELAAPQEKRAVMYVVAADGSHRSPIITSLPAEPVHTPDTTGGVAIGAWREESRIVVFLVEGDAGRYRGFLTAQRDIA
ncbi:MAG: hypothetical protein C0483_14460 [Pirellula sp.]|nr:hypothetical protein [Pirellula sp.]